MKLTINDKTLKDLEFATVLEQISEFCISELGHQKTLEIIPFEDKEKLFFELALTNEYLSSFENENRIPNHGFDDITKFIKRLSIENSYIETESFLKLATISNVVNEHKKFFKKFKEYYPNLFEFSEQIEYTTYINDEISKIITQYAEVKTNASPKLKNLRSDINTVRGKIGGSFSSALANANANGFLDDIKETVIDNHRVLAVKAMYRRKVKGSLLGNSKSGAIVYIAPESTLNLTRELQELIYEEKQEIIKILRALAEKIRPMLPLLQQYLNYLIHIDVVGAKAKYAHQINALLPEIEENKRLLYFKDAYHPILLLKNKSEGKETIPQTVELNENQQIIVISGPNAGGKSITLKTLGLLQLMLQSGMLIPVNERSKTSLFHTILTDIGDNQSIENQLSTYSYRLKNMRYFLRKCNENTLFLIDEFGTGSDPELGGALAEIFLEEFYENKAFGVITTHYANLKVLANELEHVTNANMQFNERTLAPTYKLIVGQAGSSFTFEVAEKNGIPYRLINRAKKRVETEKVRLDKTISKLQKERNRLQRNSENLEKQKNKEKKHLENLQEKELKIREKLEGFQELYDNNQRMLSLGRQLNELLNKYFQTNNKKELSASFFKWVASEKTKYTKKNPPKKKSKTEKLKDKKVLKKQQESLKKVEQEVLEKVVEVRKEKKKEAKKIAEEKANYTFKIGDRVRVEGSRSIGTIDRIEKKKALINFGLFTTETKIEKLEIVK